MNGARGFRAAVPRDDDRLERRQAGSPGHNDHRAPRREEAALHQRVLPDQRIAVPRLPEDDEIEAPRAHGKVRGEFVAHALHQAHLRTDAGSCRLFLEGGKSRIALRPNR